MAEPAPYEWGSNHYCEPDVVRVNESNRDMAVTHGLPVQLESNPEPPTFCSFCLNWFDDPAHQEGSAHRPPEKGTA
jgi:hypothetical protein